MADTKITDLTELSSEPASSDVLAIVDVSDTTMAASGTDKKIQYTTIRAALDARYTQLSLFDANTILAATSDDTPAAVTLTEQTLLGRVTGGNIAAISIDDDLSSVSASDDTVPSAKAAKAYADSLVSSSTALSSDETAGENVSERDNVYLDPDDNKWYQIDIDADPPECSGEVGVVTESGGISADGTGEITRKGEVSGYSGLSAGDPVYASTTAGGYTQTKPAVTDGGGQVAIVQIGVANSTTSVMVDPKPIEYVERETLANNATLTIEHHADDETHTRRVDATIVTEEAGASLASYADTNQDVGVPLRGPSGAGGSTGNTTSSTASAIGNYSGTDYELAQSFQIAAGRTSQFTCFFDANVGSPTGTVTYKICDDSSGDPGSELATGTFTPTASSNNTVTIPGELFLEASTTYWLWLKSTDAQSSGNYWQWKRNTTSSYADGEAKYTTNGGSSWAGSFGDMYFSVTTAAVSVGDKLAQGFQVTGSQTVGSVQLYLKKAGSPADTMTLRIETDSGGDPSGTLVDANATTTLSESSLTTSYDDITFSFATAFSISGSTQYHIVLSTGRATDTSNYVLWGADASSPSYANGEMKSEASSVWSAESKDGIFDVLGEGIEYAEPLAKGRWSGGDRDCAVRFDDGSGSDPTTKTTFKNVTGSSVDMTCKVRVQ